MEDDVNTSHDLQLQVKHNLTGHTKKVYCINWHINQLRLLSVGQDKRLILWNFNSARSKSVSQEASFKMEGKWPMTCAISPNATIIASGGLGKVLKTFSVTDNDNNKTDKKHRKKISKMGEMEQHTGYVSSCVFVDNSRVLTASGDATIIL